MATNTQTLKPNQSAQLDAAKQALDARGRGTGLNAYGVARVPFMMSCRLWLENNGLSSYPGTDPSGVPIIQFPTNPAKATWRMGYRTAEDKTRGGRVLYAWKNRDRRSFADEPIITFQFQAGNCESIVLDPTTGEKSPPPGLLAIFDFYRLLDEEKIIPAKLKGKTIPVGVGEPNFVIINYRSKKFPLITLFGFFKEEGVEFDDDSTDPLGLRVTANFVVYYSSPRMSNAQELKQSLLLAI